jgi:MFS family permease
MILLKSYNFWGSFCMFSIYVGMFNAFSTYLYQIMGPYGYTSNDAGIAGALLIFVGIGYSALTSPLTDRFHQFKILIGIQCPIMAGCYIAVIYMSTESVNLAGPYVVCSILGAASFSLLPIFLEWTQEQTSPADPGLTSSLLWCGGQLFGAIFVIAMNALQYPANEGNPPGNMHRALIFEAVWACVGVLGVICLFTAKENVRVNLDRA